VCERAGTAKVVESGGEEEHIVIDHRLDDGGVGRGVTTTKLQPLGKVMRASSGSCCEMCITLIGGGRRRDSDIDDSVGEGGWGGVALVVGVKQEANFGGAGGGGSRDEVTGFDGDTGVAGDDETSKGGEFAADRTTEGVADGIAGGGFVVAAGKKVITVEVKGAGAEGAGGIGKEVRKNG
jgi:hypothetical protein